MLNCWAVHARVRQVQCQVRGRAARVAVIGFLGAASYIVQQLRVLRALCGQPVAAEAFLFPSAQVDNVDIVNRISPLRGEPIAGRAFRLSPRLCASAANPSRSKHFPAPLRLRGKPTAAKASAFLRTSTTFAHMRLLLTGSNGLLGQKIIAALRNDPSVELWATSRGNDRTAEPLGDRYRSMDIAVKAEVDAVFEEARPNVVIHAAAMTNVDACELDPASCRLHNVTATEHLVQAAERHNSHFIFLSTDFIFDGGNGPYREEDEPAPLSIYGQSKLDGEHIVQQSGLERWAIARTIIVYGVAKGLSRGNVVLWAKNALEKGEPIKVVNDQWRMPTLAEDLADGCIRIAKRGATGIYHLSGPDGMTILELVQRTGVFFGLPTGTVSPVTSASLGQPAKRPPVTGFVLDKARRELGYAPHGFEAGLAVLREQLSL